MGKYMRKSKATGELGVMEVSVSQAASLGVRTRAKTLALQRSSAAPPVTSSGSSYLQLRSRRLELIPRRQKPKPAPAPRTTSRLGAEMTATAAAAEDGGEKNDQNNNNTNNNENCEFGVGEASFGENVLEYEGRERTTRESTPCSLIRDPDTIRTPGSTTRPTNSAEANRRIQNPSQRHIPTAHDMDEFFSGAEEEQQRNFMEKYNFDPVNDKPLPGRYEWEKVDP